MGPAVSERRLFDLYRMTDHSGRLLYIGISNDSLRRSKEHSKDKTWWREVANIEIEHIHCSRSMVEQLEREAIVDESPIYNVKHNGKGGRPVAVARECSSCGRTTVTSHDLCATCGPSAAATDLINAAKLSDEQMDAWRPGGCAKCKATTNPIDLLCAQCWRDLEKSQPADQCSWIYESGEQCGAPDGPFCWRHLPSVCGGNSYDDEACQGTAGPGENLCPGCQERLDQDWQHLERNGLNR